MHWRHLEAELRCLWLVPSDAPVPAFCTSAVQEQPAFDKKAFTGYIKSYLQKVAAQLPEEEAATFKAKSPAAVKWLLGKLSDLQL